MAKEFYAVNRCSEICKFTFICYSYNFISCFLLPFVSKILICKLLFCDTKLTYILMVKRIKTIIKPRKHLYEINCQNTSVFLVKGNYVLCVKEMFEFL